MWRGAGRLVTLPVGPHRVVQLVLLLLRQPHLRLARMTGASMLQHTQPLLQHTHLRLARMKGATMLGSPLLQLLQLPLPVLQLLQQLVPHALRCWCMRP